MAAKNKFMNAMKMPAIADIFSSEAERQQMSGDLVTEVPLSELHPFVNHPFEVRDDEDMQKLVDSIKENGVLTNLTVRPRAEGGYEIISGHRRFHAAQLAGLDKIKVQVRDVDDDQAIIDMVDANIQREHISPMEKARAYAMKLDAIKHQGQRTDLTSGQIVQKLSVEKVAEGTSDGYKTVQRFIRLNNLELPLRDKVDSGELAFTPAVELSYLKPEEQQWLQTALEVTQQTPSLSQAQRIKKESKEGTLSEQGMIKIMSEEKKPLYDSVTLSHDTLKKYFPKSYTAKQMEKVIIKLLDNWLRNRQRVQER